MFKNRAITTRGGRSFRDEHSVYFDGTSDTLHVNLDDDSMQCSSTSEGADVSGDYNTVVVWFRSQGTTSTQRVWNVDGANPGLSIFNNGGQPWLCYNSGQSEKLGFKLADNYTDLQRHWFHVTMSYQMTAHSGTVELDDSSALDKPDIWCNGVKQTLSFIDSNVGSARINEGGTGPVFAIAGNGGIDGPNTQPFKGWISDLAIYKQRFYSSHARVVFNGGRPFNHRAWHTSQNLTYWNRMGDKPGDFSGRYFDDMRSYFDASAGSSNYGICYSGNKFQFHTGSTISGESAGYNIIANTGFTASNATATMQTDNSSIGLEIENTSAAENGIRTSFTTEVGAIYQIEMSCYKGSESWLDAGVKCKVGTSAGASDLASKQIAPTLSSTNFGFTATGTTTHIQLGPNSSADGAKCRVKVFWVQKIIETVIKDASRFNNADTVLSGEPIIVPVSPH